MKVSDFNRPEVHPFGMLRNYDNANEKESLLVWILGICIDKGEWVAIETKYRHPGMVDDGLLLQPVTGLYALTPKAKGLLYGYYCKFKELDAATLLPMVIRNSNE